jgi:hypothetical protein
MAAALRVAKKCIDLATSMPLPRINTALQKVLMVMNELD